MAEPYIGEIRAFGFIFNPRGWVKCDGQLLPISAYEALYSIVGTIYGGDGQSTFAVPNLQGRVPMHWGNGPGGFNTQVGEVQGAPSVTLQTSQMPAHTHAITGVDVPSGGVPERTAKPDATCFIGPSQNPNGAWNQTPTSVTAPFSSRAISTQGGSQPHENQQPYLVINFCMATEGIYPSRN